MPMIINKKNGKDTKEKEYKVTYVFDKNSKANVNEILKQSFMLDLKRLRV